MKLYAPSSSILLFTTILLLQVLSCQGAFALFHMLVEWYMGLLNFFQVDMSGCKRGWGNGDENSTMIICTTEWLPVVCDGICMYGNNCVARAAGVEGGCWP